MRFRFGLRRPIRWFVIAGILGAVALVLILRPTEDLTTHVVVARVMIPAGTLLDEAEAEWSLAVAAVPDDLVLRGLVATASGVVGRRTVAPLSPGEPVTQAVMGGAPGVGPAPLATGERAVPVPMRSVGGPVAAPPPGSHVDVIASDGEGATARTRVIVTNAEVLAITPAADGEAPDTGGSVVLRLSSADALAVAHALDFSRGVRVIARPPGEE